MKRFIVKQLLADLEDIIKGDYKKVLDEKKYPGLRDLIASINQIIRTYSSQKSNSLRFKSLLMEDVERISNVLEEFSSGKMDIQVPEIKLIELSNITYGIEQMKLNNFLKQLLADLEGIIKGDYKKVLDEKKYPGLRDLIASINQIIRTYSSQKSNSLRFKSLLMEDVERISNVLEEFSRGKIGIQVPEIKLIELSNITYGIEQMCKITNKLNNFLMNEVRQMVDTIYTSSTEITSANTEIKNNAESQLKQITEISTSTTELTASIMQVAGNAKNVADAAEKTKVLVDNGYKQTEESLSKIKEAQNMMKNTLSNLFQLKENAKKINEIIESMGKISEKSDLLALNAAIEAAGAGEIGKRFRIVADEMRRLADSSINASKESGDILKNIQTSVESNVEYINRVSKSIDEVVSLIEKTGEVLGEVVKVFTNTAEMMKEVSLATNQQEKATELLNEGMNEINTGAKSNVAGIEQSVEAVNSFLELANKLTNKLNGIVAEFKV